MDYLDLAEIVETIAARPYTFRHGPGSGPGLLHYHRRFAPERNAYYVMDSSSALSSWLTRSAVKPKCASNSAPLPEAPKRSMPSTRPSMPTKRHQDSVAPASTASRRRTAR